MKYTKITTKQMGRLLERLGFSLASAWETYRVFENNEFDVLLYLRPVTLDYYAEPSRLFLLRKISTERGIIEKGAFDELVDQIIHSDAETLAKAS